MYIDYFFSVGLWNWHGLEGRGCSQFCWRGSQSQHPSKRAGEIQGPRKPHSHVHRQVLAVLFEAELVDTYEPLSLFFSFHSYLL